jgi:DNA repair photolyase
MTRLGEYKTILSPQNNINIYRGCSHGCVYCDSRSACYQMGHSLEDVEIKRGAAAVLDRQLARRRGKAMIMTGSMCDPYTDIEETLGVTRECLKTILRRGFGAAVLTKSARALRDLDVLKAINEKTRAVFQMTLTAFDEDVCRKIEPNVSSSYERFRALKAFNEAGIPSAVWISPILPFINDGEDNLRGLLDYCARAGVGAVVSFGFGVTLREGSREYFYARLDELFPGLKEKYVKTFGKAYECASPNEAALKRVLKDECEKKGIIHGMKEAFDFIRRFEPEHEQLALF